MKILLRPLAGEFLGTFLLVAPGTGTVASAVLHGVPSSLPAVAACWGAAVVAAILVSAPLSGAHLNPAVSLALAMGRPSDFPPRRLLPYWGAQLAGAAAAGAVVLATFGGALRTFEAREGIVRGAPGSERAAMVFGEYFPNPAMHGTGPAAEALVGPWQALAWETGGTAALVAVVLALAAARAPALRRAAPWIVGATVAAIIVVVAPATQCGINPARDLGPRLVAWAAGWGHVAIPGPRGGAIVYVAGPLLGAAIVAAVAGIAARQRER